MTCMSSNPTAGFFSAYNPCWCHYDVWMVSKQLDLSYYHGSEQISWKLSPMNGFQGVIKDLMKNVTCKCDISCYHATLLCWKPCCFELWYIDSTVHCFIRYNRSLAMYKTPVRYIRYTEHTHKETWPSGLGWPPSSGYQFPNLVQWNLYKETGEVLPKNIHFVIYLTRVLKKIMFFLPVMKDHLPWETI